MRSTSFSIIHVNALIAMEYTLVNGDWGLVKLVGPTTNLADGAALPVLKTLALQSVRELAAAMNAESVERHDDAWMSEQRRAARKLASLKDDDDPAVVLAATQVASVVLMGGGTAQTALSYAGEVDWGLKSILYFATPEGIKNIKILGFQKHAERIKATTIALRDALGTTPATVRMGGRAAQLREATRNCQATLGHLYGFLELLIERATNKAEIELITRLKAPFDAVYARFQNGARTRRKAPAKPEIVGSVKPPEYSEE